MISSIQVSEKLTIFPLVSPEAGWKLELFYAAEPIGAHYHKKQRQIILLAEGEMKVSCGGQEMVLREGEFVTIDPGVVHSLNPHGAAHFFAIDLPGYTFPEDVYFDSPEAVEKWAPPEEIPFYLKTRTHLEGYCIYELAAKDSWSVALLEIDHSPRHFHKIEKELFIVVGGELDIEIDGVHQLLRVGESIRLLPGEIHQLKSARKEPVRVLCFSFPAFDPSDMYF